MPRRWVPMGSFLVSHLESALDRSFPGAARRGAVGARSSDRPRRRRPAGARLERARLGSCSPCAGPGQLPLSRGFSVPMVPPESGSARREEPLTGPPPDVPQQCPRPQGMSIPFVYQKSAELFAGGCRGQHMTHSYPPSRYPTECNPHVSDSQLPIIFRFVKMPGAVRRLQTPWKLIPYICTRWTARRPSPGPGIAGVLQWRRRAGPV